MAVDPEAAEVRAAGGVVWRRSTDGGIELALVHRPRYDDWSFPKGKLDPGESWEAAALREVREETGLECTLGRELPPTGYRDPKGRSKAVRYWLMEPRGGVFAAARHTDELVAQTRAAVAALLGADPAGIAFGPSMTALTMRFAATVGRTLRPGDEIVCTRLDHDANVRPWAIAAERAGATLRLADPEPGTLALPASGVEAVLSGRPRRGAGAHAPNAVGPRPD